MIADWIDHELRNWARWCWSGAWPHPLPPGPKAVERRRKLEEIEEQRRIREQTEWL